MKRRGLKLREGLGDLFLEFWIKDHNLSFRKDMGDMFKDGI